MGPRGEALGTTTLSHHGEREILEERGRKRDAKRASLSRRYYSNLGILVALRVFIKVQLRVCVAGIFIALFSS